LLCWEASTYAEPLKVGLAYASADGAADLSLNWMANEGLLRAVTDLGVVGTTYTPTTEADYDALLNQCVDDGNALCLSVGFQMADATWNSAAAHPDVDFAIVDLLGKLSWTICAASSSQSKRPDIWPAPWPG